MKDVEILEVSNHPQKPELGSRKIPFSKTVLIEREDFAEIPPPKFKRLTEGGEVRLRSAYVIKCNKVIKDEAGNIIELRCSYDSDTLGKKTGRKKSQRSHSLGFRTTIINSRSTLIRPSFPYSKP